MPFVQDGRCPFKGLHWPTIWPLEQKVTAKTFSSLCELQQLDLMIYFLCENRQKHQKNPNLHIYFLWRNFVSMPKRRKSSKQLEKDREENRERMSEFCKKKTEEQALKDSLARQQALKQLGITQEFNYSDHAEIYSYADRAHAAPIETIEASIPPPEITQYPERSPCPSPCSVRGEQINHALTPTARTAVARFRRAKAIMQAHCAK